MRPPASSTWAASATRGGTASPESRHFVNVASAGLTGVVADRVNRSGKPLGATAAFAWAAVATFAGYRNSPFTVEIDDERIDQVCNNAIVANCRYFAGGMKIAPDADPSDGLLDVLVWGDVSRLDLARNLHKLYRGTHTDSPQGHDPSRPPGGGDAALAAADRGRRRAAGSHPGHVRGGAVSSPASRSRLRRRGAWAWQPRPDRPARREPPRRGRADRSAGRCPRGLRAAASERRARPSWRDRAWPTRPACRHRRWRGVTRSIRLFWSFM